MNPTLTTTQRLGAKIDVGMMLAIPGYGSRATQIPLILDVTPPRPPLSLTRNAEDVIESVHVLLSDLVMRAITTKSAEEFQTVEAEVFPSYFEAALGLSLLVRTVVQECVIKELGELSFAKLESVFQRYGLDVYGADVKEQALFTVWTLKKIASICQQIDAVPAAESGHVKDRSLFVQFAEHSMRTTFYLDCLSTSIMYRKTFHPDILPILIDGLRSAVNAYAYVRRVLDLRSPMDESEVAVDEWDDEDEELLRIATNEVVPEPA